MIQNASFQRKVIYLGIMALLLLPLYMIGAPATGDPTKLSATPGGTLAQLRRDHDLAPSELGEIDPASESMKLATLGMRGIAANFLWSKANHYKKTEDWEKLVASVNQITKLQPNFVSVWEFQSHNLSYNISAEHDDYRFRYLWVKKGIEFLIRGTRYNRNEPKIFWNVGWYTGQKFGRADEHEQFRVLFHEDDDFHAIHSQYVPVDTEARGANGRPDNWLTSRLWYENAYTIVETGGAPIRGKAPHLFYSDGPKARMNYASTIETEGYLDERAQYAWRQAGQEWDEFGNRIVPSSWGNRFRLNDKEATLAEAQRTASQLDELLPGVREQIRQEKIAKLPAAQQEALRMTMEELYALESPAVFNDRYDAEQAISVSHAEVAERAPAENKALAVHLAKQVQDTELEAERIGRYRENVNFEYWKARCTVEQLPETVKARRHVYDARQKMDEAKVDEARTEFETAWKEWAGIIQRTPELVDALTEDDLAEDIQEYVKLLAQLDEELPNDFALMHIIDKFRMPTFEEDGEEETSDPASPNASQEAPETSTEAAKPAEETPAPDKEEAASSDQAKSSPPPAEADAQEEPSAAKPESDQPEEASKPAADDAPAAEAPEKTDD